MDVDPRILEGRFLLRCCLVENVAVSSNVQEMGKKGGFLGIGGYGVLGVAVSDRFILPQDHTGLSKCDI